MKKAAVFVPTYWDQEYFVQSATQKINIIHKHAIRLLIKKVSSGYISLFNQLLLYLSKDFWYQNFKVNKDTIKKIIDANIATYLQSRILDCLFEILLEKGNQKHVEQLNNLKAKIPYRVESCLQMNKSLTFIQSFWPYLTLEERIRLYSSFQDRNEMRYLIKFTCIRLSIEIFFHIDSVELEKRANKDLGLFSDFDHSHSAAISDDNRDHENVTFSQRKFSIPKDTQTTTTTPLPSSQLFQQTTDIMALRSSPSESKLSACSFIVLNPKQILVNSISNTSTLSTLSSIKSISMLSMDSGEQENEPESDEDLSYGF